MSSSAGAQRPIPFDRILITGASGFVGRHLLPALRARLRPEAELFLADRQSGANVPLDITDVARVRGIIEDLRPDLVIHLAGQAATGLAADRSRSTWAVNFGGTFALAGAISDFVPDCTLLYASSVEVYGLAFNKGPVTETTPLEPTSTYARSKAAAEWMLGDTLPTSTRLVVMRPSNHIGAGQTTNFVLPAFAEQIAKLERGEGGIVYVGNLDVDRDFMNVRDVASA
jgi:GDP-4-dehydro-6-deoxy-D-mannose reductase